MSTRLFLGPWSYPTLTKFNDSIDNAPCGTPGPFLIVKAIPRHPFGPETRWILFPLPALSLSWQ